LSGEVLVGRAPAADGGGRPRVGARRAAEAEVEAAGVQGVQGADLFGDHEGRVVGQFQAAGADADGLGSGGDGSGQDDVGGARHWRHVVVFGEPVALEAQTFGVGGEFDRAVQCVADGVAPADGGEVQEGERRAGRWGWS
jgi:hypothetical protein